MPRLSVILAATLALSGCVGGGRTTISAAQEVPADAAGGAGDGDGVGGGDEVG